MWLLPLLAPALALGPLRPQPAPAAIDAHQLYQRDCAVCHGADASGTDRGPSLVGVGRASIDYWVSTGRMPLPSPQARDRRRPSPYSPRTMAALIDEVAAIAGRDPDIPPVDPARGDLARGGELFRLDCAACHAWGGEGGALQHREAPSVRASSAAQIAEAVRIGPGLMPAFGSSAITDHDLDGLAAYVLMLRNPQDRGGEPLWHLGPLAEGAIAFVFGLGLLLLVSRMIGSRA